MPFLHCIPSFDGTSYKNIKRYSHQILYFLLFLLTFTSAVSFFHIFLELHSTLSEKKDFSQNFSFLTDSLKPPTPLMIQ